MHDADADSVSLYWHVTCYHMFYHYWVGDQTPYIETLMSLIRIGKKDLPSSTVPSTRG